LHGLLQIWTLPLVVGHQWVLACVSCLVVEEMETRPSWRWMAAVVLLLLIAHYVSVVSALSSLDGHSR
jgi:hypothetical protein